MAVSSGKTKRRWFFFDTNIENSTSDAIDTGNFYSYQIVIMHDWLQTVTIVAAILVPLFFLLDLYMIPEKLIFKFAAYRSLSAVLGLLQALIVRKSKSVSLSYFYSHGYFISFQIGFIIALMTNDLGGFNSSYYAGLNLVIVGVNLLMPWEGYHTGINSLIILMMYLLFNLVNPYPFSATTLLNNLFFMTATAVMAMSITHVRYMFFKKEFSLLTELKKTKDSLWSEIELAKKIQTALLPKIKKLTGYSIANIMIPAKEVGGDYCDIIETKTGDRWVAIGDVAGHGVDSGLIMMMAQSIIMTLITGNHFARIQDILNETNTVLRENIFRLGSNHYMTTMLLKLDDDSITLAGHHQDLLLFHDSEKTVDVIGSKGTWLGITDDISGFLEVRTFDINEGDTILLYTDGATESLNSDGEMYGQERLAAVFKNNAALPVEQTLEFVLSDIQAFQSEQEDDITLIVLKKDALDRGMA